MKKILLYILAIVALSVSVSALNFVSDTSTQYYDGSWHNAVATWIHPAWTTAVTSEGGTWIWNSYYVSDNSALNGEAVKFQKTFDLGRCKDNFAGTIDISADNTFAISLNGNPVGSDLTEFNYQGKKTYDLSSFLTSGVNTLTIESTNLPLGGGTPTTNPAGIVFVGSASCDNEVPEFGVIAGAVALVGALGIFLYRRK